MAGPAFLATASYPVRSDDSLVKAFGTEDNRRRRTPRSRNETTPSIATRSTRGGLSDAPAASPSGAVARAPRDAASRCYKGCANPSARSRTGNQPHSLHCDRRGDPSSIDHRNLPVKPSAGFTPIGAAIVHVFSRVGSGVQVVQCLASHDCQLPMPDAAGMFGIWLAYGDRGLGVPL